MSHVLSAGRGHREHYFKSFRAPVLHLWFPNRANGFVWHMIADLLRHRAGFHVIEDEKIRGDRLGTELPEHRRNLAAMVR